MEIILENLYAWIVGSPDELEKVKQELTFSVPGVEYIERYLTTKWDRKIRLYQVRKEGLKVFRGIGEWVSEKYDCRYKERTESIQLLSPENDWRDLVYSLRDYQEESVIEVLKHRFGLLDLATNAGKTLIAAGILKAFRKYGCVYLVHRRELFEQSREFFVRNGLDVGMLKSNVVDLNHDVVVCMLGSLSLKTTRNKMVKDWWSYRKVILVDECHHVANSKYFKRLINQAVGSQVRVGLSGTIPREGCLDWFRLRGMFGKVLKRVTNEELIEKHYSVKVVVNVFVDSPCWFVGIRRKLEENGVKFGIKYFERKYWETVRKHCIVQNVKRNKIVADICRDKDGVLIIVDRIEHGRLLNQMIQNSVFVFANSDYREEVLEDFRQGRIKILIASPILEEGVDVSGIRHLVIASGGKSRRKLLQRIGRGLRLAEDKEYLEVYDFYDDEVPLLERHVKDRLRVYKEQGFELKFCRLSGLGSYL